ncbi:glycosyltransferase involved in cell wall biosynthesis [Methanolinea mesophila]|uniref:glycosyltransferase family 4 protein n=1 Tax=Methanolinea mesophila TaxID=547055 RepID=UPI001AEAFFDF|nr:glycosyltransferase family 4 protein [Methanolinea mesophila]MBP1927936.1 glycosyltransferase involved in cell wall biosynthesis [Methanolinea mesophila]
MRILLIHSNYDAFGGGEIYVSSLMRLLKAHGNDTFLFSFSNREEFTDESMCIVRDHFYDRDQYPGSYILRYFARFYINPRIILKLRHWISQIKPDIIHINANDRYGISVLIALHGLRIPVIQSVHAYTVVCMSETSKKPFGELCRYSYGIECFKNRCLPTWKFLAIAPSYALKWNLTKRIVDRIIAPNNQLKQRLLNCGAKNMSVIQHFVDRPLTLPDTSGVEPGNILCVGRISKEKGFQYVILSMLEVRNEFPAAVLHICGDGPYLDELKLLSKSLNLDQAVQFHGYVNQNDLGGFYERANVVVFPSMCLEICGLVNLEALAYARPLIVSDQCGVEGLFIDELTVNPSDVRLLSGNILSVLKDRDRFQEMSKNSYDLYNRRYSPEIHYERLYREYSELQAKRRSA